jgi:uncharacterized protein DUF5335
MTIRTIAPDAWQDELDSFSRQHEGWVVSVKTRAPDGGVAVAAHDLPLHGVSPAAPSSRDIAIILGDSHTQFSHEVRDPVALKLELTPDEAARALVIDSDDGTTTTVEFRSPMRPEEVDGLPFLDGR